MRKYLYLVNIFLFILILSCSNNNTIIGTWRSVEEDSIIKIIRTQTFYEDNVWKTLDTISFTGTKGTHSAVIESSGVWEQNNDIVSIRMNAISAKDVNMSIDDEKSKRSFKIVKHSYKEIEWYDIRDQQKKIVSIKKIDDL